MIIPVLLGLYGCERDEHQVSQEKGSPAPVVETKLSPAPLKEPPNPNKEVAIAKTSGSLGFYNRDGFEPIDDRCVDPSVILAVIPKSVHQKDDFRWRFAEQVMLANQQLKVQRLAISLNGHPVVAFVEATHTLSGGVALVASCNTGAVCNELAGAYKVTVPTSKPKLVCGDDPKTIRRFNEVEVVPWEEGKIKAALPAKDDVVAKCVRLAACEAQETGKLEEDIAIRCQKRPGGFKTNCALKYPCAEVLSCASGD